MFRSIQVQKVHLSRICCERGSKQRTLEWRNGSRNEFLKEWIREVGTISTATPTSPHLCQLPIWALFLGVWLFFFFFGFHILVRSYSIYLSLSDFSHLAYALKVHLCFCKWQDFILFHSWLYKPHFLYSSSRLMDAGAVLFSVFWGILYVMILLLLFILFFMRQKTDRQTQLNLFSIVYIWHLLNRYYIPGTKCGHLIIFASVSSNQDKFNEGRICSFPRYLNSLWHTLGPQNTN